MPKNNPKMMADDVIKIVQPLNQNHIEFYIDGGWGVDALLEEQTRPHADLDIAIQHKDMPRIRTLLEAKGSRIYPVMIRGIAILFWEMRKGVNGSLSNTIYRWLQIQE